VGNEDRVDAVALRDAGEGVVPHFPRRSLYAGATFRRALGNGPRGDRFKVAGDVKFFAELFHKAGVGAAFFSAQAVVYMDGAKRVCGASLLERGKGGKEGNGVRPA
jgi:hypothetical protein